MDFKKLTEQYYSLCLGTPNILCDTEVGITFVYSDERNQITPGYSSQFDIYALFQKDKAFISYGNKAISYIELLKQSRISDMDDFSWTIHELYNQHVVCHKKFCYQNPCESDKKAIPLEKSDYLKYLSFFKTVHPFCQNTDWVEEYFYDMTDDHLCCGVFDNGMLVSCTDTPDMPYLSDKVQEIGINTLREYRGRGYAAAACSLCAENIIANGKCPQWSCAYDNIASARLAEKIGFVQFADVVTVTLE